MRYCITHEAILGDWEVVSDFDDCIIAYSAPPEFDESWDAELLPPDEDELILMDMNAEVLEADFLGA